MIPVRLGCVYLDHVGTTLYARSQLESVQEDLLTNLYGNPHSHSVSSTLTTDTLEQTRDRVLGYFQAPPDEYSVIFTSSCTAALRLVADSFDFSNGGDINYGNIDDQSGGVNDSNEISSSTETECGSDPNLVPADKVPRGKNKTKGCFCYLLDNHTSVQGIREVAASKGAEVICLEEAELTQESLPPATRSSENENVVSDRREKCQRYTPGGNCVLAFPAQSNFSGRKYPLDWLTKTKEEKLAVQKTFQGSWFTLLDAASFVTTSPLDLSLHKPDFVTISFYKIFGYPTGLGALLVHKDAVKTLNKIYFGGGTVSVSTAKTRFHVHRPLVTERFEDGTLPFLNIVALRHGIEAVNRIGGGMQAVSKHTFSIARYFHHELDKMRHGNGKPVAVIYCDSTFDDISVQGAIVNFNILRANGEFAGFAEVDHLAHVYNIHFRTGCFCNIGACQKHLNLSEERIRKNFDAGHVCGDQKDLVDGLPTGSIRVSFGYMSTLDDAKKCLQFIANCFLEDVQSKPVFSKPHVEILTTAPHKIPVQQQPTREAVTKAVEEHGPLNEEETKKTRLSGETLRMDAFIREISRKTAAAISRCSPTSVCLTNIYLYPVKSCKAFEVTEWKVGAQGFVYDRNWMIINESGVCLNQKREPKLCQLQPRIDLEQRLLFLHFPGQTPYRVPLEPGDSAESQETSLCTSKICGDRINITDCGDGVSDWLTKVLERPGCRLIQQTGNDGRKSKLNDAAGAATDVAPVSLTNMSQFLLVSRSSVVELSEKIEVNLQNFQDEELMDTEDLIGRFRGNIVIGGGRSFDEDSWNLVQIGQMSFVSQGPCSRCQMISMDQRTGQKSNEPLRTLGSWRGGKILFGLYLRWDVSLSKSTILRVGDPVTYTGH